jgi:exoribonuclease-2
MAAHGLSPDPPQEALLQLSVLKQLERSDKDGLRDLTGLLWCSIDNDDSRDLDQLSVAEVLPNGATRLLVAVADVDVLVKRNTPLDLFARKNTTSVYTGIVTFPMLPEKLSTDWTSLNENVDRVALIIEMMVDAEGAVGEAKIDRAWVRNKAQLTYKGVSAWLEAKGPLPPKAASIKGMDEQLRIQDAAAQRLRKARYDHGALDLETIQSRPVTENDIVVDLVDERQDRAQELIEDLMVAANGVTTRFLSAKGFATFRRVVRSPERWARIVETAVQLGGELPGEPDSKALNQFLMTQKQKDPLRFPDLCLTVVKLMGRGEYVMEAPGQAPLGHFGLAVQDYSHSTAPNRRYPDLITHRLLKAALNGNPQPYDPQELSSLASHCTLQENEAEKVERQMRKSAAAVLLEPQVGRVFDGLVTGASDKGVWVRIFRPPIEGKVIRGEKGLDVGDRCKVRLVETNVENGWIDFETAHGDGGKGGR